MENQLLSKLAEFYSFPDTFLNIADMRVERWIKKERSQLKVEKGEINNPQQCGF